jgi:hypothetical protein
MAEEGSESFRAVDKEMRTDCRSLIDFATQQGARLFFRLAESQNHCKVAISGENEGLLNQPVHDVENSSEIFHLSYFDVAYLTTP